MAALFLTAGWLSPFPGGVCTQYTASGSEPSSMPKIASQNASFRGKAGWAVHAKNFDGAAEYGDGWCHFGCAVRQLDPTGKFSSASDVWRWAAAERRGGGALDFESCCSASGFDTARCACARRQ